MMPLITPSKPALHAPLKIPAITLNITVFREYRIKKKRIFIFLVPNRLRASLLADIRAKRTADYNFLKCSAGIKRYFVVGIESSYAARLRTASINPLGSSTGTKTSLGLSILKGVKSIGMQCLFDIERLISSMQENRSSTPWPMA